jgi:hypothetical protein
MGKRGTDIEEFLMKYPYMLRWVNERLSCHHKGYKPEMPEPEVIFPCSSQQNYAAS